MTQEQRDAIDWVRGYIWDLDAQCGDEDWKFEARKMDSGAVMLVTEIRAGRFDGRKRRVYVYPDGEIIAKGRNGEAAYGVEAVRQPRVA